MSESNYLLTLWSKNAVSEEKLNESNYLFKLTSDISGKGHFPESLNDTR